MKVADTRLSLSASLAFDWRAKRLLIKLSTVDAASCGINLDTETSAPD